MLKSLAFALRELRFAPRSLWDRPHHRFVLRLPHSSAGACAWAHKTAPRLSSGPPSSQSIALQSVVLQSVSFAYLLRGIFVAAFRPGDHLRLETATLGGCKLKARSSGYCSVNWSRRFVVRPWRKRCADCFSCRRDIRATRWNPTRFIRPSELGQLLA